MQSAAQIHRSVFQETGVVVDAPDGDLVVETGSGRFSAAVAVSCLVEPVVDDHVLLAVPPTGELYVLAVLGRRSSEPVRLRIDGDAAIQCAGKLSVFAADTIALQSPSEVSLTSAKVTTTGIETTISSERLSVVSRLVEAHSDQVKGVLGFVDTVLERLTQRVKRSYRFVEEIDMTRADAVDIRADKTVNLRGKNTFMTAEEVVKMMGEQIHLG